MAKAHVYVRGQVHGTDAQVKAVQAAVEGVEKAVDGLDGSINVSVNVELDEPEPVTKEPVDVS